MSAMNRAVGGLALPPQPDRSSYQPTTPTGQKLLDEWLMLRPDYPPNTARVRDMILDIEREARRG